MSAAAVSPEAILKELSQLWVSLGKQDDAGVLRACAMTLIMAADESEDSGTAGEMLAELIHENPSRAIVLRVRAGGGASLESRVVAQCWMPFGKRQQICCEQVELTSSESSLAEVRRVLMALIAPDLPVVVVCRSLRLFLLESFRPIIASAGKVIMDSHRATDPAMILAAIAGHRGAGRDVQDLAWTRLTGIRQEIASVFDRAEEAAKLPNVRTIEIAHAPGAVPSEALYLAAWLRQAVGPQAVPVFAPAEGSPVSAVAFHGEGVEIRASFPSAVAAPRECELLREELGISSRDSIYDDVLARALTLA